jgi:O-antigen/teichoic acid export membrane protein
MYRNTTRWMLMAALPIFLVMMLIPNELLRIFGEDFVGAVWVLRLIGLGQFINVMTGPVGVILQMTKYVALNFLNAVLIVAITIFLQIQLIPSYGILGAAIADLTGLSILNFLRLAEVFFLLRIHPFNRGFIKPFLAATLSGGLSLWWLQHGPEELFLRIVLTTIIVFLVYGICLWLLKLDEMDKELIKLGMDLLKRKRKKSLVN